MQLKRAYFELTTEQRNELQEFNDCLSELTNDQLVNALVLKSMDFAKCDVDEDDFFNAKISVLETHIKSRMHKGVSEHV